jgi:iron(III) transport system ATP-binding protein
MGSNNPLPGTIAEVAEGRALFAAEGFKLWGARRGGLKVGDKATGVIRLERTKMADALRDNRLAAELVTAMFMGDRREHLLKIGSLRLRCYGDASESSRWLEPPADDLWLFPGVQ